MKSFTYISFLICILFIFINIGHGQIWEGPNQELGTYFSYDKMQDLNYDVTNWTVKTTDHDRTYNRYDYSFLRLHLRNTKFFFHGYIDVHPRVDEFTTVKFLKTGFIYDKINPDYNGTVMDRDNMYTLSGELIGLKNVTTYTHQWVNVSRPCWVNGTRAINSQCNGTTIDMKPMRNWYVKELQRFKTVKQEPIQLPEKKLTDKNSETFVSTFVIVIQLDDGKIVDATWDGDRLPEVCKKCDACIDNQCGVYWEDMPCDQYNGCILKIIVAWAGRDASGTNCRSINRIPSNFQRYSATPYKNIGRNFFDDFMYRATYGKDPNIA
ncbi:hypothetical protein DDB_G0269050 [Dictyostelium discoideum AX4]|uniref:Uncharacterized protein n=1 Tax=Dictyostelium discoideum TaxID=44689 RepID=Q55F28_DICDI|nr:hypothetical protein DDB_G0269050 [Dictyostelium discoideum AX4]EAL73114.1 hypothetical protein DDB_G0269050 [Dictyostelium discoideum AX4]|eukprot:XP_646842.1 hypothetical protein DDB_G0269050 [Dictyostelium discoideum AX4]